MMPAPIFVGGTPRSGTTLTRAILNSHPDIACGPELRAIPALARLYRETASTMAGTYSRHFGFSEGDLRQTYAALIASFLAPFHARSGKRLIAEKTPANALYFLDLHALFPQARFVHVVRDPRDVVASLVGMDWRDARTGARAPITASIENAAIGWRDHVLAARSARESGAPVHEMTYETLVGAPAAAMRALFEFLGLGVPADLQAHDAGFDSRAGENETSAGAVARPINDHAIGRWRRDLTRAQAQTVEEIAGTLLGCYGYAPAAQ